MREQGTNATPFATSFAVIAAAGGVMGVCCGLPVLFSLGVAGAVTGVSVSSWALVGLGLVLAVLGGARWVRRRRRHTAAPATTAAACSPPTAHPATLHPGTAVVTPHAGAATTTGEHR